MTGCTRRMLFVPPTHSAPSRGIFGAASSDVHAFLPIGVVTLDPQTASRSLVLSEDRKSVRYTRQKQNLPDSPLRFEGLPVVLGSPGFSSGRHRWQVEVQLGDGGGCTVGVVGEEVRSWESRTPGGRWLWVSVSQMKRDLWHCQLWSMDHVRDFFLYFFLLLSLYQFYTHLCLTLD